MVESLIYWKVELSTQLGLMENDSFDLPVPTCSAETTLGGFYLYIQTLLFMCWSFLLLHLMAPKGAVCLRKDKIYSKNAQSNSVMEGSFKPV